MAFNQTVTFASLPVIGARVHLTRGSEPGVMRLRIPHDQNISAGPGTLVLSSDGTATFAGCIPDLSTLRLENRPNGRREFSVLVYDRRASWKGIEVSGKYNVRYRDNSIEPGTEKTAAELADLILSQCGETSESDAPEAYPPGEWDSEPVAGAFQGLSDTLPVHVVRNGDDTFKVTQTGTGATLDASLPWITPDYVASIDAGPETVEIECNKTWFQCALELECVGLESDGHYYPLSSLSYTPALGWETQWPTLLSDVNPNDRQWALKSVYRVYRIKTPQTLPFTVNDETYTLTDRADIDLDDNCVVFGMKEQPEAVVDGTYWPYSDHYENVTNCPIHSSWFTLDKDLRAARFEFPVWKVGSCILPADLKLYTGFHLRDSNGEWVRERFTVNRTSGYGKRIYKCHHLWRAWSFYKYGCDHGTENDNYDSLKTEADVYSAAWKTHWDTVVNKRQINYAGTWPVDLSGNIAKITMRLGEGEAPVTRASEHFEHEVM